MLSTDTYRKQRKVLAWLLALTFAYGTIESIEKQEWWITIIMGLSFLGIISDLVKLHCGKDKLPAPLNKLTSFYYIGTIVLWGAFFFLTGGYYSIGITLVLVTILVIIEVVYLMQRR